MGKIEKSKLGYCSWLGFGGNFLFLLISSLLSYRCIGNQIGRTGQCAVLVFKTYVNYCSKTNLM